MVCGSLRAAQRMVRPWFRCISQLQRASGGSGSTRTHLVEKRVCASRIESCVLSLDSLDVPDERTPFGHVYFGLTEVFGMFRIVAEASRVKSELPARFWMLRSSVWRFETLCSGTGPRVPE